MGGTLLGVVLNDLRPGVLSRYTSYGYYYSGYYGKHENDDSHPPSGGSPTDSPRKLRPAKTAVPTREAAAITLVSREGA